MKRCNLHDKEQNTTSCRHRYIPELCQLMARNTMNIHTMWLPSDWETRPDKAATKKEDRTETPIKSKPRPRDLPGAGEKPGPAHLP